MTMRNQTSKTPPEPVHETNIDNLPSALTFFLTRAQRAQALRALSDIHSDRGTALLASLGIAREGVRS